MNNSVNPRSFVLQLLIFCIPLALYVAISAVLLVSTGEVIDLETAARIQIENPTTLFGRAYRDDFRAFKFEATRLRKPDVLALGSSRVMQFRSAMFPGVEFYNAGGAAANVYELRSFLEQLPLDSLPSTVIVGLDQDWFHPLHAERGRAIDLTIRTENSVDFAGYINLSRIAVIDLIVGKTSIAQALIGVDPIFQDPAIGMEALNRSSAFRGDGSRIYGPVLMSKPSLRERLRDALERINDEKHRFEIADEYDLDAVEEVRRLLQFGRDHNMRILGFLPPYAPTVVTVLTSSHKYGYMFELNDRITAIFKEFNFTYVNATDGGRFGTDAAFFDGFHGGETVYIRILQELLAKQPNAFPGTFDRARFLEVIDLMPSNSLIVFDASGIIAPVAAD